MWPKEGWWYGCGPSEAHNQRPGSWTAARRTTMSFGARGQVRCRVRRREWRWRLGGLGVIQPTLATVAVRLTNQNRLIYESKKHYHTSGLWACITIEPPNITRKLFYGRWQIGTSVFAIMPYPYSTDSLKVNRKRSVVIPWSRVTYVSTVMSSSQLESETHHKSLASLSKVRTICNFSCA